MRRTASRAAAPVRTGAGGRVAAVDTLRGFALLGILIVNITYMASTHQGSGAADPAFDGPVDHAVRAVVAALFEAKFFLLFSFLFGYSFTLQLGSARRAGTRFRPRFLRRLAGLFALGALHAVLLFPGDILTTYAVLGLVLLAVHRIRLRTALRLAAALLAATAAAYALLAAALWRAGGGGVDTAAAEAGAARAAEALRGDAASVVAAHLEQLPDVAFLLVFFQAPAALAMFLLGLVAGRLRLLDDPGRHERALRRLLLVGGTLGVAGGLVYAHAGATRPGSAYHVLALGVDVLTAPLLAGAWGAAVVLALRSRRLGRLTGALAPPGRTALTNYLAQSLVGALLFTGYGAGLVNRVPPAGLAAIAVALFAAQALACRWWLRHHRYGPVEWALRAWTVLGRPPWRAAPESGGSRAPGSAADKLSTKG
ncbi:DUF418 domain-containing protein [Streptomyces sp. C10-9-1]|uniref:DUF418 domain-containing protein n=1 Tax=Streptomyces sp. C10-9-1 TaxID=1859285 RepID=UPI003D760772